jgi:hypothetical protein
MAHVKNDDPGMKGERSRNQNGQLRDKRDDTVYEHYREAIL